MQLPCRVRARTAVLVKMREFTWAAPANTGQFKIEARVGRGAGKTGTSTAMTLVPSFQQLHRKRDRLEHLPVVEALEATVEAVTRPAPIELLASRPFR